MTSDAPLPLVSRTSCHQETIPKMSLVSVSFTCPIKYTSINHFS